VGAWPFARPDGTSGPYIDSPISGHKNKATLNISGHTNKATLNREDNGGFGCTLKRHPTDCAGPSSIWMHGRNHVFGQPALDEAHPGGGAGAIMRPVLRPPSVEDANGSSSNSPTCRHALGVHGTAIYTEVRCTPQLFLSIWPTARRCIHRWPRIRKSVLATTQMAEALRARVPLGGRALDKPVCQTNHDTPLRHQIFQHPCPSILVLHRLLTEALDSAPPFSCTPCTGQCLLSITCMHNIAWHRIPPIPHSQELFCFPCWLHLAFIAIFEKPPCAFSPGVCLHGFVVEFCFSHFLFLWRDIWEILVLCIFVCFSLFCEFLDFFHFREFIVLVVFGSVLTAGLVDNHSHPRTFRPVTSPSFHPTPQHTFNPTTSYHLITAPYHLVLQTSHRNQRWTWVAHHTHGPTPRKGQTRTHSGTTGGGERKNTRARVPRGEGGRHFTSPTHKQATSHRSPHDTILPPPAQPHPTYSSRHPPLAPFTSQSYTPYTRTIQCAPHTPLNVVLNCPRGELSQLSVSLQLWRFTNTSLGLPHSHSLSVCLLLWVCVVCVCFLLYLSFYLCCARCVFGVLFYIHNHLFFCLFLFLQF